MKIIIPEKKQVRIMIRRMRSITLRFRLFSLATIAALSIMSCHENPAADKEIAGVGPDAQTITDSAYLAKAYLNGLVEVSFYDHALQKISNPSLKSMTEGLMKAHHEINNRIKRLAEMKGVTLPENMQEADRNEAFYNDDKSGADFDKGFEEMMVKDQSKDVILYNEAISMAQDRDVKSFFVEFGPQMEGHLDMAQHLKDDLDKNSGNK